MTPEQKQIVQTTWTQVILIADTAAQLFYGRLFELDPRLRALFPEDLTEQRKKLMQMLGVAVAGLDRLEQILPAVQALGRRHADYGVEEAHYETVGAALLRTLAQGLGGSYTPDVEKAWAAVYGALADTMKSAAKQPVAA